MSPFEDTKHVCLVILCRVVTVYLRHQESTSKLLSYRHGEVPNNKSLLRQNLV